MTSCECAGLIRQLGCRQVHSPDLDWSTSGALKGGERGGGEGGGGGGGGGEQTALRAGQAVAIKRFEKGVRGR